MPDQNTTKSTPTWEEIFEQRRPAPESHPYPDSESSVAWELADLECARLIVNCCLFDPPIEEAEISAYAQRFELSRRQAELELRRGRDEG